jgi:hypothetical protein
MNCGKHHVEGEGIGEQQLAVLLDLLFHIMGLLSFSEFSAEVLLARMQLSGCLSYEKHCRQRQHVKN